MDDLREAVRSRAYQLWGRAGRPAGRSQEFWVTAQQEIGGDAAGIPFDPFEPPVDEPPEVAFLHGVPVGMPGERIAEAGVEDDRLADLLPRAPQRPLDD